MAIFAAVLILVLVGLVISAGLVAYQGRSWLKTKRRSTAIVHTSDGDSIKGLLVEVDPAGLVLENATHLTSSTPIGGATWVPADQVRWVQVDPPGGGNT